MIESRLDSVSCIAFDFCGTLADLRPSSTEILGGWLQVTVGANFEPEHLSSALQRASAEMPYSSLSIRSEQERRNYFVGFNSKVLRLLGCHEGDGEGLYSHFKGQDRHWVLKAGVEALLTELRARGYRVVLASNFDQTLAQLLKRIGAADLFDELFVSADLGIEKPDVAFYRHIQESLGYPAGEIAMVGDDLLLDVYPALEVGLKSVHLRMDEDGYFGAGGVSDAGYLEILGLDDLLQVFPALSKAAPSRSGSIKRFDESKR